MPIQQTDFKENRSWIAECVTRFVDEHKVEYLAKVVIDLYDAAIKLSTKRHKARAKWHIYDSLQCIRTSFYHIRVLNWARLS